MDYSLLVNTHLQSGNSLESIRIRESQMRAIGKAIQEIRKFNPLFQGCRVCVFGDFNAPVQFEPGRQLLGDRSYPLVQALKSEGVNVYNPVIDMFAAQWNAKEVASIDETAKRTLIKNSKGVLLKEVGIEDPITKEAGTALRYPAMPIIDGTTISDDPSGTQMLSHVLLDALSKMIKMKVYRAEVMGGAGPLNGSNLPKAAISDHAFLEVTFEV